MARPRRPRPVGAMALFLLVLVAATAWVGVRGLLAQRQLSGARAELATAREALLDRDVDTARAAIEDAGERTSSARSLTSDPVWRLAGALPRYGDTAFTVTALARAADELANEVLPLALDGAEQLDPDSLRSADGVVDLSVIRAATPPVVASAAAAERVQDDVQALPDAGLGPVVEARAELQDQVVQLAEALRGGGDALELAPALLGEDRPRRYLLLVQQTGESRGTGGLIGGYVELLADGGRLTAVAQGSNRDLRDGTVPLPDDVPAEYGELYGPLAGLTFWENVNLSPDLPVVSRVVDAMWQAQGGQALDGVVALDGVALSAILAGSGAIVLSDGRTVEPEQLQEYLAVEQYRGVPLTREGLLARKDQLEDVATLVAARLTGGGGDTVSLLRGLSDAVRSGHVRMASDDPALSTALALSGVDGALPRGTAPFTYPVVYNSTGGKLDHYLDRQVTYEAGPCVQGERRTSTVSVTLTNQAPPVVDLPPYLTIRLTAAGRLASNSNFVTLLVYGTPGARLVSARLDGAPVEDLFSSAEAGVPLWSLGVELPPAAPRTLVLQLDEPSSPGVPRILEQPLSRPLASTVAVPACR